MTIWIILATIYLTLGFCMGIFANCFRNFPFGGPDSSTLAERIGTVLICMIGWPVIILMA